MYDVIIVGGGPSGLTAGIYAARGGLKTLIIEKMFSGGQAATTYEIENYPGFDSISGPDFSKLIEDQAKKFGVEFVYDEIIDMDLNQKTKVVCTSSKKYESKTVILSMGANPKKLGLESEARLSGAGVSYCATCDGAFFKDLVACVIGGGDTAVEDAIYLSRLCKKVYLVHRRDQLRAVQILQDKFFQTENIEFVTDSILEEIHGKFNVEKITLRNKKTDKTREIQTDAVFVAIGLNPNTKILEGKVNLSDYGYVFTDEDMKTNVEGVFACGDIREKTLRQIVTAASDGAIAAFSADKYINENF